MDEKLIYIITIITLYITMTVLSKSRNDSYVTKQVKKAAKHAMISSLCNQIEDHEKN